MDVFDRAQALDGIFRTQALESHKKKSGHKGRGSESCIDCGDPIPGKRRAAVPGCIRCIDCQREFEGG